MLTAALDIAGWILRADPSAASDSLLPRLTAAARTLAPGDRTVVRVSPNDLEAVTSWAREGVEVVPDSRLAAGEARLDRGEGSAVLTFSGRASASRRHPRRLRVRRRRGVMTAHPGS